MVVCGDKELVVGQRYIHEMTDHAYRWHKVGMLVLGEATREEYEDYVETTIGIPRERLHPRPFYYRVTMD